MTFKLSKAGLVPILATVGVTVTTSPAYAGSLKDVADKTFGSGGPGVAIIQLLLIAAVGWIAGYIAQAFGKGQIANMIHMTALFSCLTIVASVAWNAIKYVATFAGLN